MFRTWVISGEGEEEEGGWGLQPDNLFLKKGGEQAWKT